MSDSLRTQQRYDHRLRQLIQTTGDLDLAVRHGVPRSTARGWLKQANIQVVSIDVLDMDAAQLQQEILRLQSRLQKLIALLRVLLAVLKISGFSLNQIRLPDGNNKRSLLRAIERARTTLPLRSVLRVIIRLSPSRYHHWNGTQQCELDDGSSCPQLSPHQLTAAEVKSIQELVTSDE
jgi:hypothetical protein